MAESRAQRTAITGLLLVCVLLGGALVATAVLSHRAASAAARDVLHSRADGAAASFVATARVTGAVEDRQRLQQLAEEMAGDEITLVVCDAGGTVHAAAGAGAPPVGTKLERSMEALRDLRVEGQSQRMIEGGLEYWRPLRGRPGRGGPGWRGWRRWQRKLGPPDRPGTPGQGPGFMRRVRLLRVTVSIRAAEDLLGPARTTTITASVAAVILLVLGILMHRAARRAQRAEEELRRREALSALGEMAAVLAHEIRTPLGSIKGNAQLIGEGLPGDERIEAVVRETGRLERLVNGLLDYARPAPPRREAVDPDLLMRRAAEIVAPKAAAASVNLVTDLEQGGGPCLQADPDQILQVLVNLLQNAVEASGGGEAVVARVRRSGAQVAFAVLDSGPGLPEGQDLEQLARPFHSTKEQGSGLGLSVALQIARQHGGRLTLQSRKEGGTAAQLTLPRGG